MHASYLLFFACAIPAFSMHTVSRRPKRTSHKEGERFAKRVRPIHLTDRANHAHSVKNPNFFANNVPNWRRQEGECRLHHTKMPHLRPNEAPSTSKQRVSHRIGKIWAKIPGFFTDSTDSDLYVEGRSEQASPPGDQARPDVGAKRVQAARLTLNRRVAVAEDLLDARGRRRTADRLAAEARGQGEHRRQID